MPNYAMIVHIAGGSAALLAGAGALAIRKGSRLHGSAGTLFAGSMVVLTATGSAIAASKPDPGTAVIGILTAYLVLTAWAAARRRDGTASWIEWSALVVALACAAALLTFGLEAAQEPRPNALPAGAHYPFAALAALAASLDLAFILRGRLTEPQRLRRHLWRMCTAFLIAAFSFFIGQQKVMPEAIRGSPLLFVPELLILGMMIYWIVRLRWGWGSKRRAALPAFSEPAGIPAQR